MTRRKTSLLICWARRMPSLVSGRAQRAVARRCLAKLTLLRPPLLRAHADLWGPDALPDADTGRTILWLGFWGRPSNDDDAQTILPQGLYLMLDVTGRDASQYALKGWLYNGAFYTSTDEFRAAWSAEGFEKPSRNAVEGSESWVSTDRKGAEIPLDTTLPPIQDQPGEKRFTVDEQGYVEWGECSRLPSVCWAELADVLSDALRRLLVLDWLHARHWCTTFRHSFPRTEDHL